MWNKFKNWFIKQGIKGILLKKGRVAAHSMVDKIFNEIENTTNKK